MKLFATTRSGQDLGLESSHATRSVLYPKLDITDRNSVRDFAEEVKQYGTVDVLINNAGVNLDEEYNVANVRKTMDINYKSMLNVRLPSSTSFRETQLTDPIFRCAKHSSPLSPNTAA